MTTPLWFLRRLYALDDVLIEELAGVLGGHGRGASGDCAGSCARPGRAVNSSAPTTITSSRAASEQLCRRSVSVVERPPILAVRKTKEYDRTMRLLAALLVIPALATAQGATDATVVKSAEPRS